jgi:uncharacterized protein
LKYNRSPLTEKMFFFPGSGNRNLLGFLHYSGSASSTTGIVYCHPFAEEKNMSHSIVVKTARLFASAGFHVFRFDLSGCGDSEGDLQFSSIEDWQQDLNAAINIFQKETGASKFFLWGLRLGAGLCLLQQEDAVDIAGLVLWQPVLDFSVHIEQFLRRAITTQISNGKKIDNGLSVECKLQCEGLTHVIGYPISKHLYDNFTDVSKQPKNISPPTSVFILSISLMDQPNFGMKQYAENLKKAGTPVLVQHVKSEPFWDRYWQWECKEPADVSLQWLQGFIR